VQTLQAAPADGARDSDGFLAAAFYGPQSRIMDGVLARAAHHHAVDLLHVFQVEKVIRQDYARPDGRN
jgi:hypothetical protein